MPVEEAPRVPVQNQKTPSRFNWKSALLLFLIGATLIFGGLAAYYYVQLNKNTLTPEIKTPKETTTPAKKTTTETKKETSKVNETEDWNVYTDSNITFKYPTDWKRYKPDAKQIIVSEKDPDTTPGQLVAPKVEIQEVSSKPAGGSYGYVVPEINELLNSTVGATWDSGAKNYEKLKNLKVDNLAAVWVRQTLNPNIPTSGPSIDHVYVEKVNKVYEISLWDGTEQELNLSTNTFSLILSTFKFLD